MTEAEVILRIRLQGRLVECGLQYDVKEESYAKMMAGAILLIDRTDPNLTRVEWVKDKHACQ